MPLRSSHTSPIAYALVSLALLAAPALGQDAMSAMAPDATGEPRTIEVTIENLLTGQPFSPGVVESRSADAAPLFALGEPAADALVAVAEGGNIGPYSVAAAMNTDGVVGDAQLTIHALPGQTRTVHVRVDATHPLIDSVWMLGHTNDGFSGFAGVDGYNLTGPLSIAVRGYDAGSENNSEKKGFLGALGGGNDRDPENGVITHHAGIRGDADAPADWNWDIEGPVAKVTFTPLN